MSDDIIAFDVLLAEIRRLDLKVSVNGSTAGPGFDVEPKARAEEHTQVLAMEAVLTVSSPGADIKQPPAAVLHEPPDAPLLRVLKWLSQRQEQRARETGSIPESR